MSTTEASSTPASSKLLENFVSDDELRRELKISDRTLRRLRLKARLPSVRLGRTIYFARAAIQEWLDELAAVRGRRKGPRSVRRGRP